MPILPSRSFSILPNALSAPAAAVASELSSLFRSFHLTLRRVIASVGVKRVVVAVTLREAARTNSFDHHFSARRRVCEDRNRLLDVIGQRHRVRIFRLEPSRQFGLHIG